ncbi:M66 family metalloprotease [Pulveribacter suum]|uniref:M66 family metalloprotease n=1 Tax=Pulveribacter suum TaxID=2116657 RepID=UPI001D05BE2F|nr:M66 family metalloprotease [Pulveribacter suum]
MRNDLGGSLPGMVQFGQSHTVDPSGNEAKNMPRLTMHKEALLLVTPDPALGALEGLQVAVTVNGQAKGTLPLRHPNDIPRSDYANNDGRPDYVYSRRAWTVALPWDWVQPGLALRVADAQGRTGMLASSAIDFAGAGELVLHSIRLGMLTDVPKDRHWFRTNPEQAATDYLQTIPAARITAAYYEDVTLPKVMVASGVIYSDKSATSGDVYSGDMRENTGKSTFSVGINLANWGVSASSMASQNQPQVTQNVTLHHARGAYQNGLASHGLSGGNSILTLYNSDYNEFSHEIGHHYGLGHYPGEENGNRFLSGNHHDSGWGYIGYRKRMRANIHWTAAKTDHLAGMPELDGTYTFTPDAMAGGNFSSSLSRYTHYTGYSTKIEIQPAFNRVAVFSAESPTGYKKWNAQSRAMENFAPPIPGGNGPVWYNSSTGKFLAPRLHGVPVVTLLGGYDPESTRPAAEQALIYPALRSNWGNVFDLPTDATDTQEKRSCWLQVDFATARAQQRIALAGRRLQGKSVNKLHVHLAQSDQPRRAELLCQTPGQPVQSLYVLDIATGQPPLPAPVIVGKDKGYSALRAYELPQMQQALQGLSGKAVPSLSGEAKVIVDSWSDDPGGLSAAAQAQLQRYKLQQEQSLRLNRWISAYGRALDANVPEAQSALMQFVQTLGLASQPAVPQGQTLTMSNGNCIRKVGNDVGIAGSSLCKGGLDEQWVLDGRGSVRSRASLDLCLTDKGGSNQIRLQPCDLNNEAQVWDTNTPKRIARGGRCFDLSGGYLTNNLGTLITYNCTGGGNQQWGALVASDNLALTLLTGDNVLRLVKAAEATATKPAAAAAH